MKKPATGLVICCTGVAQSSDDALAMAQSVAEAQGWTIEPAGISLVRSHRLCALELLAAWHLVGRVSVEVDSGRVRPKAPNRWYYFPVGRGRSTARGFWGCGIT